MLYLADFFILFFCLFNDGNALIWRIDKICEILETNASDYPVAGCLVLISHVTSIARVARICNKGC